ncbi:MOSC domain-containing protein [Calidifontibacter sp. DB0510]|uniref:MOSC domain-containing protein n=1 Tax=Metallococcus carri TaxID=1656884 RepID=A0A967B0G2_9MICO|nr:MOSC N-terminal beta barrel domain-containing protein [Metallococcus carri]NHN55138.1 MOSC domain-containing protein [Metallococcus carri]NOP36215.1 MOSC domain-containing protein [Calidifontibacter sp. DB2511S]
MQVTGLFVHPVKSTAIRPVPEAYAGRAGLRGDREWMVVDAEGQLVTARELPALFRITADSDDRGDLWLRADGLPELQVPRPAAGAVPVRMFTRPPMTARPADPRATAWLEAATGRAGLRLVWCDDPTRRTLNPAFTREGDHAAYQDNSPVTLLGEESVRQLNEWIGSDPLSHNRFRPNVVISGAAAFAEDGWRRIRIGAVPFRVGRRVDRCVMTTIDPVSAVKGKEPIRTLARHRREDGKTWMAVHLLPDGEGTIRVGDPVIVDD